MVDALVLLILAYSMVRLSFQEAISNTAWIQIVYFGGLYFTGRILFRQLSTASIPWLLTGILWGGIAQALYGVGQLYGIWTSHHVSFPVTGSFFNPGPFSGWLACLIPIAVWVLFHHKNVNAIHKIGRLSAWIYLFLGGGILIATFSRAAWLAGAAGILVVLYPHIRSYLSTSGKRPVWLLPVAGVVLIGLLSALYFFKKDSADGRILIWSVSLDMISDYPLFGVGWDRFKVMYPRYQAYYFDNGRGSERQAYLAGYEEYPFNEVLGYISEMGLLGFLLIALIPGIFLRNRFLRFYYPGIGSERPEDLDIKKSFSISGSDHNYAGLAGSVLFTWFVFSLFSYPSEIPVLAITGILVFSALVVTSPDLPKFQNSIFKKIGPICILVLMVTSVLYSFHWVRENYSTSKKWISANANYQLGRYAIANNIYLNELWPVLGNEGTYLLMTGKSLSMSKKLYSASRFLERALVFSSDPVIFTTLGKDYTLLGKAEPEKYDRAEFLLKMVKFMQPDHYYPRYLLIQLYEKRELEEKKKEEAAAMLALRIKINSEAIAEMRLVAQKIVGESIYEINIK